MVHNQKIGSYLKYFSLPSYGQCPFSKWQSLPFWVISLQTVSLHPVDSFFEPVSPCHSHPCQGFLIEQNLWRRLCIWLLKEMVKSLIWKFKNFNQFEKQLTNEFVIDFGCYQLVMRLIRIAILATVDHFYNFCGLKFGL